MDTHVAIKPKTQIWVVRLLGQSAAVWPKAFVTPIRNAAKTKLKVFKMFARQSLQLAARAIRKMAGVIPTRNSVATAEDVFRKMPLAADQLRVRDRNRNVVESPERVSTRQRKHVAIRLFVLGLDATARVAFATMKRRNSAAKMETLAPSMPHAVAKIGSKERRFAAPRGSFAAPQ